MADTERFKAFAELGELCISEADKLGLTLRTVGSTGIWQALSPELRARFAAVRPDPHDLDLLAPEGSSGEIKAVFEAIGAEPDERLIAWHGKTRHRYFKDLPQIGLTEVDVFLGRPPLCHEIDFGPLDETPGPQMSNTDLFLQKIQAAEPDEKDIIDAGFLLLAHGVEGAELDMRKIAEPLGRDWGFWYTTTSNLERIEAAAPNLAGEDAEALKKVVGDLREAIDAVDKSRRWKMRQKLGTKVQWYTPVEDVVR